jgi:hypothetical protein
MKKNILLNILLVILFILMNDKLNAQTSWPSVSWTSAVNITPVISSSGIAELSGLYWNDELKRLYAVENKGSMRVLQMNASGSAFSLIGNISNLDSPEGITQVNNLATEFFTINEATYEIRKYSHDSKFGNCKLMNSWDLLSSPSPMTDTDNDGPEGIAFVPDSYLREKSFLSSVTGKTYTSVKGMGGLMFIAHQKNGYVWVFDVNPLVSNDFAYVGKYKTNRKESCDINFNRSTGLLYILHNIDDNYLEVSDLSTTLVSKEYKFNIINEYLIPNPSDNTNVEGFAISNGCSDSTNVNAWLCRDIDTDESSSLQKDCLRWFRPFSVNGSCRINTGTDDLSAIVNDFEIFPIPVQNYLNINSRLQGKELNISIYDMTGRILIQHSFNDTTVNLNVSGISKGIYLLIISDETGILHQQKIMKL